MPGFDREVLEPLTTLVDLFELRARRVLGGVRPGRLPGAAERGDHVLARGVVVALRSARLAGFGDAGIGLHDQLAGRLSF